MSQDKKPARVLFIDDDVSILRQGVKSLQGDEYEVSVTLNPEEALEWLRTGVYDIIVSDFRMPQMFGDEFLLKAAELRPESVRILSSAEADFDVFVQVVERAGAHHALRKPWTNEQMRELVEKIIHERAFKKEVDETNLDRR